MLIFQLLMEGAHPFAGRFQGSDEPPPYEERIAAGHFPYGRRSVPYAPLPIAPPFDILHPTLQHLFMRCFEDGHTTPQARPDALTWRNALDAARDTLSTCPVNTQHRYGSHLQACPWCERTARLGGRDSVPVAGGSAAPRASATCCACACNVATSAGTAATHPASANTDHPASTAATFSPPAMPGGES